MLTKTQIAINSGQSLFQYKVKSVLDGMGKTERAIKPSTNVKLGKKITKGHLKGAKMYTLTLEERKTCPKTCFHWSTCYGNNLHLATRYTYDEALLLQIEDDLEFYNSKNKPFMVRLHVLGDFADVAYVNFWQTMLDKFQHLNIYGYTAHQLNTELGDMLQDMVGARFMVRISGNFASKTMNALSYDDTRAVKQIETKQAFLCPVQEDKTDSCGTCGLCWIAQKNVVFKTH
jgi:hypothetical protein